MNAIQENIAVSPDRRAKSGVLRQRYSNVENYGSSSNPVLGLSASEMLALQQGQGSTGSGSNAQGMINSISGMISATGNSISGIWNSANQKRYGTDAYNNALAAMYNSQNKTETKNTGLIIAIVVVAVLMVVGFGILIAKK